MIRPGRFSNFILLILIDLGVLYLSYYIAFAFRFDSLIPPDNLAPFIQIAPWIGIALILVFFLFDLYTKIGRNSFHRYLMSILVAVSLLNVLIIAISFWVRGFALPRSIILLAFLFQIVLFVTIKTGIWYFIRKIYGKKRVIVIGKSIDELFKIGEKLLKHPRGWFKIVDLLTVNQKEQIHNNLMNIDVIAISTELNRGERIELLNMAISNHKEFLIIPDIYDLYLVNAEPQQIDDVLVLSINQPLLSTSDLFLKRATDIVVSLFLIILLSPVIIFLTILIPLTSKGGPFYVQERLGKNERPFMIYKFRSMRTDAELNTGPVLAKQNDPRITTIGRFIRATRLDEIPQLFNVLKGDMSLVGPRPERKFFIDQFKDQIAEYKYRMMVKPGITGLAQVMSNYTTTPEDKLRYDLMYIRNYSLFLDIKILVMTILVVLRKSQSDGLMEQGKINNEKIIQIMQSSKSEINLTK